MKKILVIRFSSFGDIVQSMSINGVIKQKHRNCEIYWLTKDNFKELVECDSLVSKVVGLKNFKNIFAISRWIKHENFDLVYDAHNSLRSKVLFFLYLISNNKTEWLTRSKKRFLRFLLFKFKINLFPKPYIGQLSYISPLRKFQFGKVPVKSKWAFSKETVDRVSKYVGDSQFVVFAPSAAWEMKRWPVHYWSKLIESTLDEFKDIKVVLVGGPSDVFINSLVTNKNVINLSGRLSLVESSYLSCNALVTVSADTGIIHVVDSHQAGGILLNGPTAFGKTYSTSISIMEAGLYCQPCTKDGRGKCQREVYQMCMVEITPEKVFAELKAKLATIGFSHLP